MCNEAQEQKCASWIMARFGIEAEEFIHSGMHALMLGSKVFQLMERVQECEALVKEHEDHIVSLTHRLALAEAALIDKGAKIPTPRFRELLDTGVPIIEDRKSKAITDNYKGEVE